MNKVLHLMCAAAVMALAFSRSAGAENWQTFEAYAPPGRAANSFEVRLDSEPHGSLTKVASSPSRPLRAGAPCN